MQTCVMSSERTCTQSLHTRVHARMRTWMHVCVQAQTLHSYPLNSNHLPPLTFPRQALGAPSHPPPL